jgi:CRISPR-associated Csx2 family protein
MRKIITFLGRRPQLTQYEYRGKIYSGSVFAEALRQFVDYDQMLVCVTEEAKTDSWSVLQNLNDPRITQVDIPRGETTLAMWEMFDRITSRVDTGETVIFDITHGLRSLPFLVFLFAAYLKSAKKVKIEAIYYGALELGNPQSGIPAPIIDLSEFIRMLDWLTASERFIRFGDSTDLADLVHKGGHFHVDDPIAQVSQALDGLSQSLRLIRPINAMKISASLPITLDAARTDASELPSLRPYLLLVDDLKKAYATFSETDPFDPSQVESGLVKLRDLISWYLEHQQWVQAVSLAREWLVTWVMWQLDEKDFFNQQLRESIAKTMSEEAKRQIQERKQKKEFQPIILRDIPVFPKVLGDWLALTNIRNDIDHAGMRYKPGDAADLIKSVRTLCGKLEKLPIHRYG